MNDSAKDLEQLIQQYTKQLLHFQQQYAAHMPAEPLSEPETPAVRSVDAPSSEPPASVEPVMAEPTEPTATTSATPAEPVAATAATPAPREEAENDDAAGDRPLLLQEDDQRHPSSPMADGLFAPPATAPDDDFTPETAENAAPSPLNPLFLEQPVPAEESTPAPLTSEIPADRDLMSDPDAATPQAFPPQTPPAPAAPLPPNYGRLQVQVFQAGEALPIENATVTISEEGPDGRLTPITVLRTNRSGFTTTITLPTVSASLSLEPGNRHPYTAYTVQIVAPGFFTTKDIHVPVYSGVTSVQPAEMLPLPENYQGDTTITYPESEPNL